MATKSQNAMSRAAKSCKGRPGKAFRACVRQQLQGTGSMGRTRRRRK